MERYDPFAEMNRMFEQMRTRMWTPEGMGRGGFGGREGLRGGFGDFARGRGGINMDLKKHGDEYVFVADLPGFETEDIDLSFDGDALVVVAESRRSDETSSGETASDGMSGDEAMGGETTSDESMHDETALDRTTSDLTTADSDEIAVRRQFTSSRRVSERVTIPEPVAEDEISATYRNGVLEVHLPIIAGEDEDSGRKIDIAD